MRVSCDRKDSGFTADTSNVKVKLDGVEQKGCITADDELGEVVRYKHKDGELIVDRIKGELCKERLNGKVEIIFNPDET